MATTTTEAEKTIQAGAPANYAYAEPDPPVVTQIYEDQCCGCFDIRSGIIILGVWLLIESILTLIVWFTIAGPWYKEETGSNYGYYVGALVFDVLFNIIGM